MATRPRDPAPAGRIRTRTKDGYEVERNGRDQYEVRRRNETIGVTLTSRGAAELIARDRRDQLKAFEQAAAKAAAGRTRRTSGETRVH